MSGTKKFVFLLLPEKTIFPVSLLILTAVFIVPCLLYASLVGSPHDTSTKQCDMCHLYIDGKAQSPLWGINNAPANYNSYSSPTFDMEKDSDTPSTTSLCMGCHNGVFSTLMENTIPFTDEDGFTDSVTYQTETDKSHPVCFVYDNLRDTDNNRFPSAMTIPGDDLKKAIHGGRTGTFYPLYGENKNLFECTTCHNPHYPSSNNSIPSRYQEMLLRADNSGSNMCRDCHQNK